MREERFETGNGRAYRFCGIQCVSTGRQFDTQTRRRLTVIACDNVVAFAAQFNLRHVAQANLRTIAVHFQQNFAKLVGRGETGLRDDRGVQLLPFHRRRTAQLPGRDLGVLRFNSRDHVDWRQLEVIELVRVHPDTHRILRAEQLNVTHAGGTADRIFNGRAHIVGNIFLLH